MKNFLICLSVCILFCQISIKLFSQNVLEPSNVQTPTVSMLKQFVDVPVSLYTGIPEISIPIFSTPYGSKNLGINIAYHSGGVYVDQHPGWTGVNWSLNIGGVIARTVKQWPDEYNKNLQGSNCSMYGYYYNRAALNVSNWNQSTYINSLVNNGSIYGKDLEPDIFTFSFYGYTGSFYLNSNGFWTVKSDKPIKVEFDGQFLSPPITTLVGESYLSGHLKSFSGFTLTTDDGTKYHFGGDVSTIEYSIGFFSQLNEDWIASSWHLKKITFPNGKEVSFNYQRGSFICQIYNSLYRKSLYTCPITSNPLYTTCYDNITNSNPRYIADSYDGKMILPIYLTNISSNDFEVNIFISKSNELCYDFGKIVQPKLSSDSTYLFCRLFPYLFLNDQGICKGNNYWSDLYNSFEWKKIDSITINNTMNQRIKTINFKYNNISNQRLYLDELEVNDEKYAFEYYNRNQLPRYFENKVDHWGFFNNYESMLFDDNYYHNRRVNEVGDVQKYGMLTKIKYPTGGTTEFQFEPNECSMTLKTNRWEGLVSYNENVLTGGLRIKKIINDPGLGAEKVTKDFFYIKDFGQSQSNISSGVLGGQIMYETKDTFLLNYNSQLTGFIRSTYSVTSLLPACNNAGIHIGYSEVTVKENNNGYTRYIFSNFDNGYFDSSYDCIFPLNSAKYKYDYSSREQDRGLLLSKRIYRSDNKCVYGESYSYEKWHPDNYVKSVNLNYENSCNYSIPYYSAYRLYCYSNVVSSKRVVTYFQQDSIYENESYTYDPYFPYKVCESKYSSNGDEVKTYTTYPFNIYNSNVPNSSTSTTSPQLIDLSTSLWVSCQNMTCNYFLNYPIEITKYINQKMVTSVLYNYIKSANDYLPESVLMATPQIPIDGFLRFNSPVYGPYRDCRYKSYPLVSYLYDSNSNILQMEKNGIVTSFIYSYHNSLPIARVEGVTYSQLISNLGSFISYINSNNASEVVLTSLRNSITNNSNLKDAIVTTYLYKPLVGLISITNPSGLKSSFEYDGNDRLKCIFDNDGKIINAYQYHYSIQ